MLAIRRVLLSDVLPLLLVCALVSLVVALIELLLVLASCCFADHVKKIKDLKTLGMSFVAGALLACLVAAFNIYRKKR